MSLWAALVITAAVLAVVAIADMMYVMYVAQPASGSRSRRIYRHEVFIRYAALAAIVVGVAAFIAGLV